MSAGTAVVVALAVILTYTLVGGSKGVGEVVLQSTLAAGSDPFTPSTATAAEASHAATSDTSRGGGNGTGTLEVDGSHPGLYGGTQHVASCDVEKQITFLVQNSGKGTAFAAVLGIQRSDIPAYLRSLLPARLTWDTRVTNHGYKNQEATSYQAILQAGTAVLIDDRGVPRVRCACGNPLTPPAEMEGEQKFTGEKWSSFKPSAIVEVKPAEKPMKTVAMFDPERKTWFERASGDPQGRNDREVPAPKGQIPGTPPTLPPPDTEAPKEESPGEETSPEEEKDKEKGKEDKEGEDKEKEKDEKESPGEEKSPEEEKDKEKGKEDKEGEDKEKEKDEKESPGEE
ncbi:DUF6777 domain-containing protein, partial [Streptomyces sp. NPDC001970]